ncbi:MAG: hypothetical protein KGL39_28400 [Patescibacteria group bacterium]|nr:hypothetical protein [Patescibacteria group bacterium]
MAEVHSQHFCETCGRPTLHSRPATNHLAHAVISLFLCGFWIPMWIVVGANNATRTARCTQCGALARGSAREMAAAILFAILFFVVLMAAFHNCRRESKPSLIPHADIAVPAQTPASAPAAPARAESLPAAAAAPLAPTTREISDPLEIYDYATAAVRDKLKAPASAQFPSAFNREVTIAPYGYRQWLVTGFVDSQNSFGASLREHWGAYVFASPTAVRVDYLELGTTTFGTLPPRIPFPAR